MAYEAIQETSKKISLAYGRK